MNTQASVGEITERRKVRPKPKNTGWYIFLSVVGTALIAGFMIFSIKPPYKSGDSLGYNIGLVGGLMLLTLLLYPLRKRAGFMKGFGILPKWFKWHMIFGIMGPTLILFHSTFRIGSINAGIALGCMALVAGSGVFGRFFYTKIHHGLYGRQASLQEMQKEMEQSGDVKSVLGFAPEIEQQLTQFRAQFAERPGKERSLQLGNFITVGTRGEWLFWTLASELKRTMYAQARGEGNFQKEQLDRLYKERKKFIRCYLRVVRDASQFRTYERLFSWWHILHIPLVYMLVFSAIFHVISVHMY